MVHLWAPSVRSVSDVIRAHHGPVRSVDINANDRYLLTAGDDKMVKVWSMRSKRFIRSYTGHTNWVRSAVFSPDGLDIASGSDDQRVLLWDSETGAIKATYQDHVGAVSCVRFSPDGSAVASCGQDCSINVWDTRSEHALLQHYPAHDDVATAISFHPSGLYLLSTSLDGTCKCWDLRQGRQLYTLQPGRDSQPLYVGTNARSISGVGGGRGRGLRTVQVSQDGSLFAIGGDDEAVVVWKDGFPLAQQPLFPQSRAIVNSSYRPYGILEDVHSGVRRQPQQSFYQPSAYLPPHGAGAVDVSLPATVPPYYDASFQTPSQLSHNVSGVSFSSVPPPSQQFQPQPYAPPLLFAAPPLQQQPQYLSAQQPVAVLPVSQPVPPSQVEPVAAAPVAVPTQTARATSAVRRRTALPPPQAAIPVPAAVRPPVAAATIAEASSSDSFLQPTVASQSRARDIRAAADAAAAVRATAAKLDAAGPGAAAYIPTSARERASLRAAAASASASSSANAAPARLSYPPAQAAVWPARGSSDQPSWVERSFSRQSAGAGNRRRSSSFSYGFGGRVRGPLYRGGGRDSYDDGDRDVYDRDAVDLGPQGEIDAARRSYKREDPSVADALQYVVKQLDAIRSGVNKLEGRVGAVEQKGSFSAAAAGSSAAVGGATAQPKPPALTTISAGAPLSAATTIPSLKPTTSFLPGKAGLSFSGQTAAVGV